MPHIYKTTCTQGLWQPVNTITDRKAFPGWPRLLLQKCDPTMPQLKIHIAGIYTTFAEQLPEEVVYGEVVFDLVGQLLGAEVYRERVLRIVFALTIPDVNVTEFESLGCGYTHTTEVDSDEVWVVGFKSFVGGVAPITDYAIAHAIRREISCDTLFLEEKTVDNLYNGYMYVAMGLKLVSTSYLD